MTIGRISLRSGTKRSGGTRNVTSHEIQSVLFTNNRSAATKTNSNKEENYKYHFDFLTILEWAIHRLANNRRKVSMKNPIGLERLEEQKLAWGSDEAAVPEKAHERFGPVGHDTLGAALERLLPVLLPVEDPEVRGDSASVQVAV